MDLNGDDGDPIPGACGVQQLLVPHRLYSGQGGDSQLTYVERCASSMGTVN